MNRGGQIGPGLRFPALESRALRERCGTGPRGRNPTIAGPQAAKAPPQTEAPAPARQLVEALVSHEDASAASSRLVPLRFARSDAPSAFLDRRSERQPPGLSCRIDSSSDQRRRPLRLESGLGPALDLPRVLCNGQGTLAPARATMASTVSAAELLSITCLSSAIQRGVTTLPRGAAGKALWLDRRQRHLHPAQPATARESDSTKAASTTRPIPRLEPSTPRARSAP